MEDEELSAPEPEPALEAPAQPLGDVLRVAPEDIPTTAEGFRAWIHYACVEWPAAMLVESHRAWEAIRYKEKEDHSLRLAFVETYRSWWILSEEDKFRLMVKYQRESMQRIDCLIKAREAVHGIVA